MNQQEQANTGPASVNPRSAGCILTAVAIVAAVVAAWLGLRLLKASSGDMALAAARNGMATSGLQAETSTLIEAQLARVEAALSGEQISPAEVISAVNGLLQTPALPALRLRQILLVDLPASTLPEEQRAGQQCSWPRTCPRGSDRPSPGGRRATRPPGPRPGGPSRAVGRKP